VATEASIRADGDEGLFASYSDVQFRAPLLAGDVIEVTATITGTGRRSHLMRPVSGLAGRAPGVLPRITRRTS
jgi:3-aminobutyryl-CoA ammonia-lyase